MAAVSETSTKNVVIVDDDDGVRDSTQALLEACGYRVAPFPSAADFLRHAGAENTGCLLLDLNMPGMNGIELLEVLRSRSIATPAIVLTANGEKLSARMAKAGVLKILRKPVSEGDLLHWIEIAFGSGQAP